MRGIKAADGGLPFNDVAEHQFPPLNFCMYCGATANLSREHIVPKGLGGGGGVLPASSCDNCAKITSRFEREVLQGNFWAVRAILGMGSRRPSAMPTELPLVIVRDGVEEVVDLPLHEHPVVVSFPQFHPPRIITGDSGDGVRFQRLYFVGYGKPIPAVLAELGVDDIRFKETSHPMAFARLVAKIAWGFAHVQGIRDKLDFGLVDAFMWDTSRIGDWVGTYNDSPERSIRKGGHTNGIREDHHFGYLMADVHLFAGDQTPTYGVVLGTL